MKKKKRDDCICGQADCSFVEVRPGHVNPLRAFGARVKRKFKNSKMPVRMRPGVARACQVKAWEDDKVAREVAGALGQQVVMGKDVNITWSFDGGKTIVGTREIAAEMVK